MENQDLNPRIIIISFKKRTVQILAQEKFLNKREITTMTTVDHTITRERRAMKKEKYKEHQNKQIIKI